jgi:hypothetical protein
MTLDGYQLTGKFHGSWPFWIVGASQNTSRAASCTFHHRPVQNVPAQWQ